MAGKKKKNAPNLLPLVFLAVLAIIAATVAIVSLNKPDTPTYNPSDTPRQTESGVATTQHTPEPTVTDPESQKDETLPQETEPPIIVNKYYNPLTGLECSEELSKQRPAAVMINNIREALPQEGITFGDVIYECLAEGGITRLLMLVQDYANLPQIGSVRSARDYYIDFAQNHDALFFHAGGSEQAYLEFDQRKIDHFDGVRENIPNTYFRDPWRLDHFSLEHTMVINGQGMTNAVNHKKSRTELKDGFTSPFNFATEGSATQGNEAKCVYIPFSAYQSPYFKYNPSSNTYKRWQYGTEHEDKDGNQLEFTNIIILFCPHSGPLDSSGRIAVTTFGEGTGYYVSGGKYIEIKYSKATEDAPIILTQADGDPLIMTPGKSYVAIFNGANSSGINMNYNH